MPRRWMLLAEVATPACCLRQPRSGPQCLAGETTPWAPQGAPGRSAAWVGYACAVLRQPARRSGFAVGRLAALTRGDNPPGSPGEGCLRPRAERRPRGDRIFGIAFWGQCASVVRLVPAYPRRWER